MSAAPKTDFQVPLTASGTDSSLLPRLQLLPLTETPRPPTGSAPPPSPPPPSPQPAQNAPTAASTPLSELSPPPDDFEDDAPKQDDAADKPKDAPASAPDSPPSKGDDHDVKPSQQSSSNSMPDSSPSARPSPPIDSIATPSAAGTQPTSPAPGDPKVAVMLELNEELLKVCMEFQKRRMALSEPQFQAYSSRLQSNLSWSASVVDARGTQVRDLPMMDAPPPLDFYSTERIQELYLELPTVFAKDIARRASISSSSPLKRERSDDTIPTDGMNKRQNTGDGKSMMPPPPIPSPVANASASSPFPGAMTNGTATPPVAPQLGDPSLAPQNPGNMLGDQQLSAASRERARQAQIAQMRAGQQGNRQMSPPSNLPGNPGGMNPGGGGPQGAPNAIAGPSGSGGTGGLNIASLPPNVQQLYAFLQNPAHPFTQYMVRNLPGFQQMPVQMQLQKMLQAQAAMQRERQGMQNNNSGGGGGGDGRGRWWAITAELDVPDERGDGFARYEHDAVTRRWRRWDGHGRWRDGRWWDGWRRDGGMGGGGMGGSGMGGGGMGGGGMNGHYTTATAAPPHAATTTGRRRWRDESWDGDEPTADGIPAAAARAHADGTTKDGDGRRRGGQGGSPPHPGSPMMGNDFPALRSNASIPGIARIARSPSDGGGGPGGMGTPRMGPARMPSGDEFQRMMQQQQQQRGNAGFGVGGPQGFAGQPSQGWQQNQQQQAMQMGMGGGGGGQYGMGGGMGGGGPRPGSAYGGAPSPPGGGGGMGNNQNWGGQAQGYPFAGSPGADLGMQRHMSGTPAPGMQQNPNPPTDGDYDSFNWG
ncbi:hypothetical protein MVEN_02419700 [Mycena venus]|uniref:Uncharacterized protein n=1 Tax=Mycena venus TaxID=2733690 RepID=A0A8H7CB24_9AGAR|nr:hypothetical protein MVEN_02419700 [Mycena venus]